MSGTTNGVRSTVALAKSMGLSVTAEGIETAEQLTYVKALGCELGQGFYFSKPLPGDAISRLLLENRPASELLGNRSTLN